MPNQTAPYKAPAAAAAALVALACADASAAGELVLRLLPVLGFAAAMSVLVNFASRAGVFAWAVDRLGRATGRRSAVMVGFFCLCVASTVFLSLDTTAIMFTPLAVVLARRFGFHPAALGLAVVWTANLASLPLPVSNLTNLLAVGGGVFASPGEYIRLAARPAAAGIAVAAAASLAASRRFPGRPGHAAPEVGAGNPPARPTAALAVLGGTVAALLTPVPYWATALVAAGAMAAAVGAEHRRGPARDIATLVPWGALALTTALSAAASLVGVLGGNDVVTQALDGAHPAALAAAGALGANVITNIPAYLALEPAAADAPHALALLAGVNLGPVVTPWASLATLLWADQLKRADVRVPWRVFVGWGLAIAPAAVGAAGAAVVALP